LIPSSLSPSRRVAAKLASQQRTALGHNRRGECPRRPTSAPLAQVFTGRDDHEAGTVTKRLKRRLSGESADRHQTVITASGSGRAAGPFPLPPRAAPAKNQAPSGGNPPPPPFDRKPPTEAPP